MEKRTPEGKRRHDLGKKIYKKIYYEKKKTELLKHNIQNGIDLLGERVPVTDLVRKKVEEGKTQLLVIDGKVVQFRKKTGNGYWFNNHNNKVLYLHREKLRQFLKLTEEQMKGYDVHHIDHNRDNNDIMNLQLLTREEHNKIHAIRDKDAKRHVCRSCGRTYYSTVSSNEYYCDRCKPEHALQTSCEIIYKKICENCGKEYEVKGLANANRSRFCSNKCKSAYRRKSGVDNEERICENCGKKFITNKYSNAKFCSPKCVAKRRKI